MKENKKIYHNARGNTYSKTFRWDDSLKVDYNKVASAMDCTSCHNGIEKGYIHSSFKSHEVKMKVIVDHSMPPNAILNINERIAVYNCLYARKKKILETENEENLNYWEAEGAWLKTSSCSGQQFTSNQPLKSNISKTNTSSQGSNQ